ncbi:hypothetical protein HAX54_045908 [Datura stramonium]|uniref:F-box associated beta-propeller type 1 domain-containing protein n=1 Tax=Datura stramonium TaxID=4076 RepID=A0ABS8SR94_DATST|nr:hypothetical protein [Datura stramonium]
MDPSSKDYKVVWIRDYFWKEETFTRSASAVVSVYSLSTDSWRHFEDNTFLSSHIIMSYFDSYLDGFYYWKKINGERRCEILAFDFRNEEFQVIQTPDVFNSNVGTLGLYDGSVSMLFHFLVQSKTCIEIWVMEKFGFWTKKLVLESTLIVKRPIGYGVNGEIFIETTSSNLAMIDPRTQEIVECLGPLGNGYSLQVLVYKKSLVSIKKLTTCSLTKGLKVRAVEESEIARTLMRVPDIAWETSALDHGEMHGYSLQVLVCKKSLVSIKKLASSNLTRSLESKL